MSGSGTRPGRRFVEGVALVLLGGRVGNGLDLVAAGGGSAGRDFREGGGGRKMTQDCGAERLRSGWGARDAQSRLALDSEALSNCGGPAQGREASNEKVAQRPPQATGDRENRLNRVAASSQLHPSHPSGT